MTFRRVWLVSTGLLFAVSMLWSLATPIGGAPDEPAQLIKAAATVRGELTGTGVRGQPRAVVRMKVPEAFAAANKIPECFRFRPTQPASCAPKWQDSKRLVYTTTYVGRYPPLYYFFVGLPSLISASSVAVRTMRAIGAAISAILLGLAIAAAVTWSRSRLLIVAIGVAATPLVMFLSGAVNPNSMEIAAAVCTWVAGIVLVVEHVEHPPRALVVVFVVAGVILELSRVLSPLWMVGILGVLWLLDPPGTRRLVWRPGPTRTGLVTLGVVGAGAGIYSLALHTYAILPAGPRVLPSTSELHLVEAAFGHTTQYLNQAIGVFGWPDTPSPAVTIALWFAAIGTILVLGLAVSRRRQALCLAAVAAAAILVPTAIEISRARVDGIVGQARDFFPIFVGLPLLAGALLFDTSLDARVSRRVGVLVLAGLAVAGFAAFVVALQRNVLGYTVAFDKLLHPGPHAWQAPLAPWLLIIGAAAVIAAISAWLAYLSLAPARSAASV